MIFDNCTFGGCEDVGNSTSFHSAYIELKRQWIQEAGLGLAEIRLDGYESAHW